MVDLNEMAYRIARQATGRDGSKPPPKQPDPAADEPKGTPQAAAQDDDDAPDSAEQR
jgi:hypothetical protein